MADWFRLDRLLGADFRRDDLHRVLYATDASVYRQLPLGVVWPRDAGDLGAIVDFARTEGVSLIPRTAGTSLAGQVVGSGLVVDMSRHMTRVLSVDPDRREVTVEPGVIRDELNRFLRPFGLHFGPNTSTANRCMIGGMVGNNSCGSSSIVYGSTRDRLLALEVWLSDGSPARMAAVSSGEWEQHLSRPGLEGRLYRHMADLLGRAGVADEIRARFPKAGIHRRNTGYALDMMLAGAPFTPGGPDFNFCRLLAGSEGTLALSHRITLRLDPLPPPEVVLVCAHYHRMRDMTEAVQVAMRHPLYACELMDRTVLECTRSSREQQANRFFVEGDPAAVLIMECRGETLAEADSRADALIADLRKGSAYALPKVKAPQTERVWALRAAGLGVLANLPGDAKAVACIEDTAVALDDLPDYIDDLDRLIRGFGQRAAYFAHAGAGEIHVRPILDLKKAADQTLFHDITEAVADLVKSYGGSFSGEHGDGRLRGGFIPRIFGEQVTGWFREVKEVWDPDGIFNPGKITAVPPMLEDLRYSPGQKTRSFATRMDFDKEGGILRMAERCNGSGDCRKLPAAGGTMCPSYHATRDEKDTPRARANALREYLTRSTLANPFDERGLAEVMDLCMSCKGCTRECPSGVDISAMKAEWQYQVHRRQGVPWRARFFGQISRWQKLPMMAPGFANRLAGWAPVTGMVRWMLGIHPERRLPRWNAERFSRWFAREGSQMPVSAPERGAVWLFADEFTEHFDLEAGKAAVRLLTGLGYRVRLPDAAESGRAALSMGLLDEATRLARANIRLLSALVADGTPLIGLEPSAVLGFRDEYLRLAGPEEREAAGCLAERTFLLEEFLYREAMAGRVGPEDFDEVPRRILVHGHCHQKALSEQGEAGFVLALPAGHQVEVLATGCCGMAGSFGYDRRHFGVSMQIGELSLFPAVRAAGEEVFVAASGHSCRHQIADGTGRVARHPAEILAESRKARRARR